SQRLPAIGGAMSWPGAAVMRRSLAAASSNYLKVGDRTTGRPPVYSADDVLLHDRPSLGDALVAEDREVERQVAAMDDELADAASDGRRLHEAVAAEPVGEQEIRDLGMGAEDRVVVEGIDLVVARPGVGHLDRLEPGDPFCDSGPQELVELAPIDLEREIGEVFGFGWGVAGD